MNGDLINETIKLLNENYDQKLQEGVSWDYFDNEKFKAAEQAYLPNEGEGETFASQIVTAIAKLIYKYYNDGDRYDAWSANDMTSYANWLCKYVSGASSILRKVEDYSDSHEYEEVLKELADKYMNVDFLKPLEQPKQGTIYDCDGPFEYIEDDDDEEWPSYY